MAAVPYPFFVRDSTLGGAPVSGLTPSWVYCVLLGTSTPVVGPAISEIVPASGVGHGGYEFFWDVAASGQIIGQIDCGSGLARPGDRYHDAWATYGYFAQPSDVAGTSTQLLTESYAAAGQPATLAQLAYSIYAVLVNIMDTGNTIVATKLDGITPAMTMTLDNPTTPTQRKRTS